MVSSEKWLGLPTSPQIRRAASKFVEQAGSAAVLVCSLPFQGKVPRHQPRRSVPSDHSVWDRCDCLLGLAMGQRGGRFKHAFLNEHSQLWQFGPLQGPGRLFAYPGAPRVGDLGFRITYPITCNRKPWTFRVKTLWFPVNFPLNQNPSKHDWKIRPWSFWQWLRSAWRGWQGHCKGGGVTRGWAFPRRFYATSLVQASEKALGQVASVRVWAWSGTTCTTHNHCLSWLGGVEGLSTQWWFYLICAKSGSRHFVILGSLKAECVCRRVALKCWQMGAINKTSSLHQSNRSY